MSERGLEELEEKGQKSEVTDTVIIPLRLCGGRSLPGCLEPFLVSGGSAWTSQCPGPAEGSSVWPALKDALTHGSRRPPRPLTVGSLP